MTDALLLLHLLSAAAIFAALVAFSAIVFGAQVEPGAVRVFTVLWQAGIIGVIVFGIALAIDVDDLDPWTAWVLIAIVLWLGAGGLGDRVAAACREAAEGKPLPGSAATSHWILVTLVVLMLADMIWKPFA